MLHILKCYLFLYSNAGTWCASYYQYGIKYSIPSHPLNFNECVHGYGRDDIGEFTITGIYSIETLRMGITKTYKLGTGDRKQNLGHNVEIQLDWNEKINEFRGKWYVQTSMYHGDGEYRFKFIE
ncbi:unnamed protein product [Didymodactylos carnosus]|uniref:Uncharacterized protein n=1 Tax=Didymodactylos carnosus TaxID=1234261 RepID=A0A815LF34_9BILA|nr:unnamed protein product [Didymodactylos carnosus]CAF1408462.1 unnamed protein product [Didymodactylos carnosus]CAF4048215.1 unnamed protein product [Didymodactylos carnosus]CAF4298474.1 unnamed protein product [Didymodactylos carnosus]